VKNIGLLYYERDGMRTDFKKPILEEGELHCSECKGYGVPNTSDGIGLYLKHRDLKSWTKCLKCHGEGKVDWIEKIVGKRERETTVFVKPGVYVKEIDLSHTYPSEWLLGD